MGRCLYCGESAGFLRRSHGECRSSHAEGVRRIAAAMADAALTAEEAASEIETLARTHRVRDERFERALERAWAACVEAGLRKDGVDRAQEERLDAILARFGKDRGRVDGRGLWNRVRNARRANAEGRVAKLVNEAMHTAVLPEAAHAAGPARTLAAVEEDIETAAREAAIDDQDLRALLVSSVRTEIERVLDDGLLSAEEEQAVCAVTEHFDIEREDLDNQGTWMRMVKAAVLRDLTNGIVPQRMDLDGVHLPFRLQKSETLIWVFRDVDYSTVRTRREFRGGHAGVSVRVARGVYFRTGAFRGRPVQFEETVHVDTGLLGVTTRHLYFAGDVKRFRVRHDRVVTIEPYSDGVGIMRDGVRAKPETFQLGDGWFAYNLLQNIETP